MTTRKRKQRRSEESRLRRAKLLSGTSQSSQELVLPPGAVAADHSQLTHNRTYSPLPSYYLDKLVECRQCRKEEVWPAERQKWWYEVAKGNIFTEAVLCRACREKEKARKAETRRIHQEGLARKRRKQP